VISHETASSSAECSRYKPPFSFVRGQDSTTWDIVWVSPQGHGSVSVSCHFLLQAPQCPCSSITSEDLLIYYFLSFSWICFTSTNDKQSQWGYLRCCCERLYKGQRTPCHSVHRVSMTRLQLHCTLLSVRFPVDFSRCGFNFFSYINCELSLISYWQDMIIFVDYIMWFVNSWRAEDRLQSFHHHCHRHRHHGNLIRRQLTMLTGANNVKS